MACLVMRNFSFNGFRAMLRELHLSRLASLEAEYVSDVECRRQWQTIEMSLEGTQPRTAFDFNGDLYRFGARQRFPSTPWLIERWCVSNS